MQSISPITLGPPDDAASPAAHRVVVSASVEVGLLHVVDERSMVTQLLTLVRDRPPLEVLSIANAWLGARVDAGHNIVRRCSDLVSWLSDARAWNLETSIIPAVDAITALESSGYGQMLDWAYSNVGLVMAFHGDCETGLAWIERALELARPKNDSVFIARALVNRGSLMAFVQDFAEATRSFSEAMTHLQYGPQADRATCLQNQAYSYLMEARQHEPLSSERRITAMLALGAATEGLHDLDAQVHQRLRAWGLGNRGTALALLGEHAQAEACFSEGLALASTPRVATEIKINYAALLMDTSRFGEARLLLEDAFAAAPSDSQLLPRDRILELRVRLELNEGRVATALRLSERRYAWLDRQFRLRLARVRSLGESLLELERVRRAEASARAELVRMSQRVELLSDQSRRWMDEALRDPLTGILNRRGLGVAANASFVPGSLHCVVMIDLDHFKSINDQFGHAIGDQVLVRSASLFAGATRDGDVLARTGGEEFCVLLNGVDLDTAIVVCDRLLETLRSADWRPLAVGLQVTASIGLVRRRGDETLEGAIERADDALYRAKVDGRDRVRFMG